MILLQEIHSKQILKTLDQLSCHENLKLLFATILISSCTAGIDFSDDAEEKLNLVDQYFKAVEKKDVGTLEEVQADGFVSYGSGLKNTLSKKQYIEGWKKS